MSAVYVVRTTVQPGHDEHWMRWQDEEHIGNLLALPGYLGVQRFADLADEHRYANVWRLEDRSAMGTADYRAASLTEWFDRIRPFYDVEVDFSEEDPPGACDPAPWREQVVGLVVDRAERGADLDAVQPLLGPTCADQLAACNGVVRVVRLARLADAGQPSSRSSPSDVLLTYLSSAAVTLPPPGTGVQRRSYRALTGYRTAPG